MKPLKIGRKILLPAVSAAISCGATYWFCTSQYEARIAELEANISDLEAKERDALVTKRISEQMEDIAFQQKMVSDEQRERAEEQSRIADMERGKAEIERAAARQAEQKAVVSAHKAVLAAHQADSMRVVAEHHMIVAQEQKATADTLLYQAKGIALAQSAIQQSNAGNESLAALMSYAGWDFTRQYGGNQYQQDVFTALVESSGADKTLEGIAKGNFRGICVLKGEKRSKAIVLATDYGEILTVPTTTTMPWGKGINIKPQMLFADNRYDFRSMLKLSEERTLVLDINGNIAELTFGDKADCQMYRMSLPDDYWHKLLQTADGRVVAIGRRHIAWLAYDQKSVVNVREIDNTITAAGQRADGTTLLFCNDGQLVSIDKDQNLTTQTLPWMKENEATAYVYQSRTKLDVIGSASGQIYIYDGKGQLLRTLLGHTGSISAMDQSSFMVMTAAYDNTIRIWNMRNYNDFIVSNEVSFDRWPLCFLFDTSASTLQIGLTNGAIHSLDISAKSNAEKAREKIQREFTQEEWEYYVGKKVPYKTFMP